LLLALLLPEVGPHEPHEDLVEVLLAPREDELVHPDVDEHGVLRVLLEGAPVYPLYFCDPVVHGVVERAVPSLSLFLSIFFRITCGGSPGRASTASSGP